MDAGTATVSKTRSPTFNAEDTNQFRSPQPFIQQQPQVMPQAQYGSNYGTSDLITPSLPMMNPSFNGSGSRKASLTSQSVTSMQRMFKRNKGGDLGPDVQFDDENGVDIQDLTGNMSFDDIRHLRGNGPYSATGANSLDTTPIIPTLGSGNPARSNIQYRKQMNHQMKMKLANGARAMSLAGGNPMQNQGPDARSMSLASFSNNNRAMSLNQANNPQGRAMSLSTRGMPPPGNRAMSLKTGPVPRSMSLTNQMNGHLPQMNPQAQQMQMQQMQMQQMQMQQMQMNQNYNMNPVYMNQMQPGMQPMQGQMQPMQSQMQPIQGQMQPIQSQMQPGMQPIQGQAFPQMGYQNQGTPYNQHQNASPSNYPHRGSFNQNSKDSLMNVLEETDEEEENKAEEEDDEDVVYKFENDDEAETLSRKSTLKKSNSMRVRKLNLFNEKDIQEESNSTPSRLPNGNENVSPSFNVNNNSDVQSMVKSASDEINQHLYDNKEKLGQLGANAAGGSGATDVFYTANDLNSQNNSLPSPNIRDSFTSKESSKKSPLKQVFGAKALQNQEEDVTFDTDGEYDNDDTLTNRGSPKSLPKQQSRSLTENTAFHNFRQVSGKSVDNFQSKSNDSSDKSDLTISKENYQTNPSTANTSSSNLDKSLPELANVPILEDGEVPASLGKKKGRINSITGRSKNIFKRLSKSKRSSGFNSDDDESYYEDSGKSLKRNSLTSTPTSARRISLPTVKSTPFKFTKEELGIMSANNDLLNELELVTTELASSINRELTLESRLKDVSKEDHNDVDSLREELTEKLKTISELQEKLTKEKRLRYISEEHALLMENGQSPSPLKLNYEKTEIYKQLLIKNDMVNQLQDKLSEYQADKDNKAETVDPDLINKYNELLKENADLKLNVIPSLHKKMEAYEQPPREHTSKRVLSLANSSVNDSYVEDEYDQSQDQMEIHSLKHQRDELREIITKLNSSHNYEMKLASDKLKSLERKVKELTTLNEKLRERLDNPDSGNGAFNSKGGKLQGFSIVSPSKLFDD